MEHTRDVGAGAAVRTWRGLGAAAGMAEGRAHVLRSEWDVRGIEAGAVLVLRHPTPAILSDLIGARAAVCETGGMLNHLAVLARELGVPCVTGIGGVVDAIAPGARLRVDGTKGRVALLAGDAVGTATEAMDRGVPAEMRTVLRFGRFSTAFARVDAALDVETAVRIAALLSTPAAFAGGARWPFAIGSGAVQVDAAALRGTVDAVVGQLEAGTLTTVRLREWYRTGCAWPGWAVVRAGRRSPAGVRDALMCFVRLNQITWLASAVKEPLVERYRAFLDRAGTAFDQEARARIFLDSLVLPGRSFVAAHRPLGEGEAAARRGAVMEVLRHGLREQDYARATHYLAAIGDLVEICERKHTDLAGCAGVLFGRAVNRQEVAALFGVDGGEQGVVAAGAQRAMVDAVLAGLDGLGRDGVTAGHAGACGQVQGGGRTRGAG